MTDSSPPALLEDARQLSAIVATTIGPFGANKLLVQDSGDVTITASGSMVLDRFDLTNPAVELLRTGAAGFRSDHLDGTSTLVALTGAFLDEATDLLEMGLHPTVIERGYRTALDVAREYVENHGYPSEDVGYEAIARTALTAVRDPGLRTHLGREIASVAEALRENGSDEPIDRRNVKVVPRVGGALSESELVSGVVLDARPVLESMPRSVDGGVALVSETIDVPRPGSDMSRRATTRLRLSPQSFDDRRAFDERERADFEAVVERVVGAGCTFAATKNSVNDRVKRTLANHGLLLVQRVDDDDVRRISRATGARIVPSFSDVTAEGLGAASVAVRRKAGRDMTFVETTTDERVYTLFCRAPDPRTLDAFSKSVESAVAAVTTAARSGSVVPGGGAVEMGAASDIFEVAPSIDDRSQLAVRAAGRAFTAVPRHLARSSGIDGQDALVELRLAHGKGRDATGVDVLLGEIASMLKEAPVVEPAATKLAIWDSAVDLSAQLLRIDERLPAADLGDSAGATGDDIGAAADE